jgi:hypothetical protein
LQASFVPAETIEGRDRMVAIAVQTKNPTKVEHKQGIWIKANDSAWGIYSGGPQEQKIFAYRFPLGLRDSATVTVLSTLQLFSLAWKIREMILKPIGKYISDQFFNGQFMVVNFTETEISHHVSNYEAIDVRIWIQNVRSPNSSLLLL